MRTRGISSGRMNIDTGTIHARYHKERAREKETDCIRTAIPHLKTPK